LEGVLLNVRFNGLYDLAGNNLATVRDMHSLSWEVSGEAWKWLWGCLLGRRS